MAQLASVLGPVHSVVPVDGQGGGEGEGFTVHLEVPIDDFDLGDFLPFCVFVADCG